MHLGRIFAFQLHLSISRSRTELLQLLVVEQWNFTLPVDLISNPFGTTYCTEWETGNVVVQYNTQKPQTSCYGFIKEQMTTEMESIQQDEQEPSDKEQPSMMMSDTLVMVTSYTLVSIGLYSAILFGASFAGLAGEWPMVAACSAAIVTWGTSLALSAYIFLRFSFPLMRMMNENTGDHHGDEKEVRKPEHHGMDPEIAAPSTVPIGNITAAGAVLAMKSLAWTRNLLLANSILAIMTTYLISFGAFVACGPIWLAMFYHFAGLVGSILGFVLWYVLAIQARRRCRNEEDTHTIRRHLQPIRWWSPVLVSTFILFLGTAFWLGGYLFMRGTGIADENEYPPASSSPYKLPFPQGHRSWIVQGNGGSLSHYEENYWEHYSWDFHRQCGTPVLASRGGMVTSYRDDQNGKDINNYVRIDHGDGTQAWYYHIQKDSVSVDMGTRVEQGQPIAKVGNVGQSMVGHIHFEVETTSNNHSIPISFRDVVSDGGIPRTYRIYVSGNEQ
mgnify:CR=1 FL=1